MTCVALARRFIPLCCAGVTALTGAASPLSPAQALKSFQSAHGLRVELVAAEPTVVDPVAMAFDEHGRLYVVENRDYPTGPPKGARPAGTIALLEDRDADGAFEHRADFVEGLTFPNGILPWNGGIYVTCAPDLLYFKDTDGDGKSDVRKVVLTGFSTNSTTQLRVSHPTLAPDGWIHLTSGLGTGGKVFAPGGAMAPVEYKSDCRFNPATGAFEPTEARAQFGLSFDDAGHRFICMNRVHVQHVVMPARYLKRNPHIATGDAVQNCPEQMSPEPLKGHGAAARIYPIAEHVTTADSHEGTFTAACGVLVYRGDALPLPYRGNVFACEPTGNLVHRDELIATGSTFSARRVVEGREFLASTDTWFRPVFLASGPDGALYICDMYRKTIEHPEYLPQEVRKGTDFESGKGMGRIYRVTARDQTGREGKGLDKGSIRSLCRELSSPNGWNRDTAQRLLIERGQTNKTMAAVRYLRAALKKRDGRPVQHLRLLDAFGSLEEASIAHALSHSDPGVRENALQIAEGRLASSGRLADAIPKLSADPNPRVRMQCALSLGDLRNAAAVEALAEIAMRDANDSWTRLAILSSVTGNETKLIETLLRRLETTSEANTPGVLSLFHELGRVAGSATSNATVAWRALGPGANKGVPPDYLLSVYGGMAEGLRGHGPPPRRFLDEIQPVLSRAENVAADRKANVTPRQHAIGLLALANYNRVRETLLGLLRASEPGALQLAAVRSITTFPESQIVPDLLSAARWQFYSPAVRDAVLNSLLSNAKHLPATLSALEAGQISKAAVDSNRRRQLLNHKDSSIRARAELLFKTNDASDRMKTFEEWKSVINLAPSASNGRAVFKQHCGACHRLDREGVNVGPDLFGIRNQTKEAILMHIIVPEQEIAPGFAAYEVQTIDGRTLTGLVIADTPSAITIRGGQGQEDTVARSNIGSLTSQGLSLMPQDLEKNMTRQDMADLLAFLKGEQDRPRQ